MFPNGWCEKPHESIARIVVDPLLFGMWPVESIVFTLEFSIRWLDGKRGGAMNE